MRAGRGDYDDTVNPSFDFLLFTFDFSLLTIDWLTLEIPMRAPFATVVMLLFTSAAASADPLTCNLSDYRPAPGLTPRPRQAPASPVPDKGSEAERRSGTQRTKVPRKRLLPRPGTRA